MDPTNRVYCGAGVGSPWVPGPGIGTGLFTSDDGGLTWDLHAKDETEIAITGAVTGDTKGNLYYTSKLAKVLKSVDGGQHWAAPSGFLFPSTPMGMVAIGDRLFTGTLSNGVYFSDDGAITWQAAAGLPAQQRISQLAAIGAGGLVGLDLDVNGGHGLYRTTGSNDTWIKDNGGLSDTQVGRIRGIGSGGNGVAYAWTVGALYRKASLADNWLLVDRPGGLQCHLCDRFPDRGNAGGDR